jgi:hypothetical protein
MRNEGTLGGKRSSSHFAQKLCLQLRVRRRRDVQCREPFELGLDLRRGRNAPGFF